MRAHGRPDRVALPDPRGARPLHHVIATGPLRIEMMLAYQHFFAFWKDADPDVPVLVQAKREYVRLTASRP